MKAKESIPYWFYFLLLGAAMSAVVYSALTLVRLSSPNSAQTSKAETFFTEEAPEQPLGELPPNHSSPDLKSPVRKFPETLKRSRKTAAPSPRQNGSFPSASPPPIRISSNSTYIPASQYFKTLPKNSRETKKGQENLKSFQSMFYSTYGRYLTERELDLIEQGHYSPPEASGKAPALGPLANNSTAARLKNEKEWAAKLKREEEEDRINEEQREKLLEESKRKTKKLKEEYTIYPEKIFEALKKYSDEMVALKVSPSERGYTCHSAGKYDAELALEILLKKHPERVFQLRGKILDTIPPNKWWGWHWNLVKILYEHKTFITEEEKKYLIKERYITTEEQIKLWRALDKDRTGDLILKVIADFEGWDSDSATFQRAEDQLDQFPWRYSDLRNILNQMPQKYWGTGAHRMLLRKMILYEEPMTSQELELLREKSELPLQKNIESGRWDKKQIMERSIVVNGVRMRKP